MTRHQHTIRENWPRSGDIWRWCRCKHAVWIGTENNGSWFEEVIDGA